MIAIGPYECDISGDSAWVTVSNLDGGAYSIADKVPANAVGVVLHITNETTPVEEIGLRKPGSTDNRSQTMDPNSHFWAVVGVNASRQFQIYTGARAQQTVRLVGYLTTAEAVFFTNAKNHSPSVQNSWQTKDLSSDCPNASGIFTEHIDSTFFWGIRKNGSTDDRRGASYEHLWGAVGLDSAQRLQAYTENPYWFKVWVQCYIKDSVEEWTWNTNHPDISLGSTGSWVDIDLSAYLPNGGFAIIEVFPIPAGAEYYGLRPKGSSEDVYYKSNAGRCWAFVPVDENGFIQGKIASTDLNFYLVGYYKAVAPPTLTTNPATSVESAAATLNGTLDDDGEQACDCGFEWGETIGYGNTTPTQSRTTGQTFAQTISGLDPTKTYHFRAFATNAAGTSYGVDRTFTTLVGLPTVTTDPASALSAIAATLNGTLDHDGGEACECGFEWGLDTGYGTTTPPQSKTTGETFSQVIGGLFPGTHYHFRAFAANSAGISYGADRNFTTTLVISRAFALAREEL